MAEIFPFQRNLRDYFKQQTKTWEWFAQKTNKSAQHEAFKTDLLKNAYRIDKDAEPDLYNALEKAKTILGIPIPVTIYQSQNGNDNNAGIAYLDTEAHIIFSGTLLKILDPDELLALLGHELSHVLLYQIDNGDFEITNRIIDAIARDVNTEAFYLETARLNQLFTELFCDKGALKVCGNYEVVIATLVKVHTGLQKVSAESYLKQTDEILSKADDGSSGTTHPEIYYRSKAIKLFADAVPDYDTLIENMINGKYELQNLHLFSKPIIQAYTKHLVDALLKLNWTKSEYTNALYRQYFIDYNPDPTALIDEKSKALIQNCGDSMKNYFCYVMLDFAMCDTDITLPFTGHIFDVAEQLDLSKNMEKILKKEFSLTERAFKDKLKSATTALNEILAADHENAY